MRAEGLGEFGGATHLAGGPSSFSSLYLSLLSPVPSHSTAAALLCPPAHRWGGSADASTHPWAAETLTARASLALALQSCCWFACFCNTVISTRWSFFVKALPHTNRQEAQMAWCSFFHVLFFFLLLLVFFTLSFLQFIEQQQCLSYINLKYLLFSMGIALA